MGKEVTPREFWIVEEKYLGRIVYDKNELGVKTLNNTTHVIEYTAYQALEQENAKLKLLIKDADFYSNCECERCNRYREAKESAGME